MSEGKKKNKNNNSREGETATRIGAGGHVVLAKTQSPGRRQKTNSSKKEFIELGPAYIFIRHIKLIYACLCLSGRHGPIGQVVGTRSSVYNDQRPKGWGEGVG